MAEGFVRNAEAAHPFTVQFELVCQTDSVKKALAGGSEVWFVPTTFGGKPCYRVFWGHYASREEALASMHAVPGELAGGSKPTVVRFPR